MEKNEIDRIPFRVESPRGDDIIGTNTNTGAIISDHEAETRGEPFQAGIPRDQIQKAIEEALKKEKWVCIEKQDGSTELLTKKDILAASDERPDEAVGAVKAEHPKESPQPAKIDWKDALKPVPAPAKNPGATNQMTTPVRTKPKEEWVSKFASIKSATVTHKGKGG